MINTCKNDTIQKYIPLSKMNYKTKLKQMLKEELGYQGKPKVLELLASEIEEITQDCYTSKEEMRIGQIKIIVPSKYDKPSFGQTIEETKLVTVVLNLISSEDMDKYLNHELGSKIARERLNRIAIEAIEQGGVLTCGIAAMLLGTTQQTITRYCKKQYEEAKEIIPLRGFIHDLGRTTTHKRWIIELYLNGYTTKEIIEKTKHTVISIDRYLKNYMAIITASDELKTFDCMVLRRVTGKSESLIKEHLVIYAEYKEQSNIKRIEYYQDINDRTEEIYKNLKSKK